MKKITMAPITSFPPIADKDAEILILGSMPGEASLKAQQYYAHPHNLFWPFVMTITGGSPDLPYERRTAHLTQNRIALWDVLEYCVREGSLDSAIRPESEQPNDLAGFIDDHQSLRKVCFNGQKAYITFKKYVLARQPEIAERLELIVLPSTSPANASIPREEKLRQWTRALTS